MNHANGNFSILPSHFNVPMGKLLGSQSRKTVEEDISDKHTNSIEVNIVTSVS